MSTWISTLVCGECGTGNYRADESGVADYKCEECGHLMNARDFDLDENESLDVDQDGYLVLCED